MNIKEKQINIENIENFDLFDHNKKLIELEILFTKIENDN
jgi:hypothetical protein